MIPHQNEMYQICFDPSDFNAGNCQLRVTLLTGKVLTVTENSTREEKFPLDFSFSIRFKNGIRSALLGMDWDWIVSCECSH